MEGKKVVKSEPKSNLKREYKLATISLCILLEEKLRILKFVSQNSDGRCYVDGIRAIFKKGQRSNQVDFWARA